METHKCMVATLILSVASVTVAQTVYDNSVTDLNTRFRVDNNRVGDEIVLGGSDRLATAFSFEYYGLNFSGNEMAQVRFYRNDGGLYGSSSNTFLPNSVFYDSGLFPISATPRSTLNFDMTLETLAERTLPDDFTWSVEFSGIEAGENAGLDLYNPPTVGSSFPDYWYFNAGAWELRTNSVSSDPINFAARFDAVPEPSMWALLMAGGTCGAFFMRRRFSRR